MTRTLVAVGGAQSAGLRAGLAELRHLDDESGRVSPLDVDGLSCRGGFRLLAGTGEGTAHHDRPFRHRAQELTRGQQYAGWNLSPSPGRTWATGCPALPRSTPSSTSLKTRGHCRLPNEIGSLSVFTGAVTAL
jgi:hypothetical protein